MREGRPYANRYGWGESDPFEQTKAKGSSPCVFNQDLTRYSDAISPRAVVLLCSSILAKERSARSVGLNLTRRFNTAKKFARGGVPRLRKVEQEANRGIPDSAGDNLDVWPSLKRPG